MNEKEEYKLTYEETTFWGLFKITGFNEFKNWSLPLAVIFTLWICGFIFKTGRFSEGAIQVSKDIAGALLGASGGIFGIVIAALTVTIALFHQALLPGMLRSKLLHSYLFPFWKAVGLWAVNIFVCLLLIIFNSIKINCYIPALIIFEIFIFLYSTFYTVKLSGLVIQLALQRAQIKE
ncbi:hypothetical protein DRW41_17265 [Neobacillus piezotolerans]|uniref:Uncharacterized protein n=1 Tax=Neobacillus piezotolerans TaxID=2259171 RepID=A0A3D8GLY9_9BACI|nr:hypothetical protein [Neobacillus piezotolerans]RDU35490.1 hypothetical protein DRW41_17265 [Neobacillus piezotolerans]